MQNSPNPRRNHLSNDNGFPKDFSEAGKLTEEAPSGFATPLGTVHIPRKPDGVLSETEILRLKERKLELLLEKREQLSQLPHRSGFKKYVWQREFFESYDKELFLTAANQVGKALENSQVLYTPYGLTTLGELQVGDFVYGMDGQPTKVIAIPYIGEDECYEIEFDDGEKIVASGNHEWVSKGYIERFRKTYTSGKKTWENKDYGKWTVRTTSQIFEQGNYDGPEKPFKRISIPMCEPVRFLEQELFDPYLLGLYLGDGSFTRKGSVTIYNSKTYIKNYINSRYPLSVVSGPPTKAIIRLNGMQYQFRALGLEGLISDQKFIPKAYLFGSIDERKALLAGLLDTDGYAAKNHIYSYCTTSPHLKEGFISLVHTLGGKIQSTRYKPTPHYRDKDGNKVICKPSWEIVFKVNFNPFRTSEKASKWVKLKKKHERIIYSVKPVGKRAVRCISVANESQTFLAGKSCIVTHNSTINIATAIEWCGNKSLWPRLWGTKTPRQLWYLYPSQDLVTDEVDNKWIPELLPRGAMKTDPAWGWSIEKRGQHVYAIHFNTGLSIYFKAYSQDVHKLQAATIAGIFSDEELPTEFWDELNFRRISMGGYFRMVFTATLGQELWYDTMERQGTAQEKFPQAKKMQISLYDCMKFEDGSPSHIDETYIKRAIALCKNEAEVQKRVMGRFAIDSGLKYASFDRKHNVSDPVSISAAWPVYIGVDLGSGGDGHPSAITAVAVSPDYLRAVIFSGWRGNKDELTTDTDVFDKLDELMRRDNLLPRIAGIFYDYQAKSFGTVCQRKGLYVMKADKSHAVGESVLNVLFKNRALTIFDTLELQGLITEFSNLKHDTSKRVAVDDFVDSARYALSRVPFDWSKLGASLTQPLSLDPIYLSPAMIAEKDRRSGVNKPQESVMTIEQELDALEEYYDGF